MNLLQMDGIVLELLVRLVFGGVAAFFAIVLWTRVRDAAWILVIAGILASYAALLYEILGYFGFFPTTGLTLWGMNPARLISDNVSVICFIVAFILMIRQNRL